MKWFVDAGGIGALVPAEGGGFERVYLLRQFSGDGASDPPGSGSYGDHEVRAARTAPTADAGHEASSDAGPGAPSQPTARHVASADATPTAAVASGAVHRARS